MRVPMIRGVRIESSPSFVGSITSTASTSDFTVCDKGKPSSSATASHFERSGVAVLVMGEVAADRTVSRGSASASSTLAAKSESGQKAIASSPVSAFT